MPSRRINGSADIAPGGIRTHGLLVDNEASTPGCSARALIRDRSSRFDSSRCDGPGGIRTLSISRSEREWSSGCLPGLERTDQSGGWNRTSVLRVQGAASRPAATTPEWAGFRSSFGEEDSNLHGPASKAGGLPISRSPSRVSAPCESRTRVSGLRDRCLAARPMTQRKGRESNPQGSSLARFRIECRRPSACPSVQAPGAGIEPAGSSLTMRRMNQLMLPRYRHNPVGAAGFEPAISCSQGRRNTRLSHAPIDSLRSAQRESNPHIRHGEAVGSRYIMGTFANAELSKRERERSDVLPGILADSDSGPLTPEVCFIVARLLRSHPAAHNRLDAGGPREVRGKPADFPRARAHPADPLLATPGAGTIGVHPATR